MIVRHTLLFLAGIAGGIIGMQLWVNYRCKNGRIKILTTAEQAKANGYIEYEVDLVEGTHKGKTSSIYKESVSPSGDYMRQANRERKSFPIGASNMPDATEYRIIETVDGESGITTVALIHMDLQGRPNLVDYKAINFNK